MGAVHLALSNFWSLRAEEHAEKDGQDELVEADAQTLLLHAEKAVSYFRLSLKLVEAQETDPHYVLRLVSLLAVISDDAKFEIKLIV